MVKHAPIFPHHSLHPADELGEVREKLRRLKAREGELRQILLAMPDTNGSCLFDVGICTKWRRVFLKEKLSQGILDRPELWEMRMSRVVTLQKRLSPEAITCTDPAPVDEDDFQVIEPF